MMTMGKRKLTKNEKRRLKKKQKKNEDNEPENTEKIIDTISENKDRPVVKFEDQSDLIEGFKEMQEFSAVFERFQQKSEIIKSTIEIKLSKEDDETGPEDSDEESDSEKTGKQNEENTVKRKGVGRIKRKHISRFTVAELKQIVERADLVETHDNASPSPLLLLELKSKRASVPVPEHWSDISKYLSRKRGQERSSYKLPEFIADTGINKIREALEEKEADYSASRQARERARPKMGKLDIDYQVLYDAFFKHQTKPRLTKFGDMYHQGMEHDSAQPTFQPGILSANLIAALEIVEGGPPPWLINMQRYGPPPAYPDLKIPGLNCPIPSGASFGFHPGGWGKAPVDQFGTPLYGDVFGVSTTAPTSVNTAIFQIPEGSKELWGEPVEGDESSSDDEEDEDQEEADSDEDEEVSEDEPMQMDEESDEEAPRKSDTKPIDVPKPLSHVTADAPEGELYRVIETVESKVGENVFGGEYTYKVGQDQKKAQQKPMSSKNVDSDSEDLEKNFRF